MSFIAKVTRNTMRYQAASALAHWIQVVQVYPDGRKGITPEDLAGVICQPEPVFKAVFDLLRQSPAWDPDIIRSGKRIIAEMGEERVTEDGAIIDAGKDDYWQILRQDVLHEHCHQHALLLSREDVWPFFCYQMDLAKDILLAV